MGGAKHFDRSIDRSGLKNLGVRIRDANGTLQRLAKQRMILDDQEPGHLSAILALFPTMRGISVAPRHSMSAVITLDHCNIGRPTGQRKLELVHHALRDPGAGAWQGW